MKRLDELADDLSLAGLIAAGAILVAVAVFAWRRLRRNVVRSEQHDDAQRRDGEQQVTPADREPVAVGQSATGPRTSCHGRCVCDRPAPNRNADDKEQAS